MPDDYTVDPFPLMTTAEAAPLLRSSAKRVRRLCALPKNHREHLPSLRKGREYLIRPRDIDSWITRQIEAGE